MSETVGTGFACDTCGNDRGIPAGPKHAYCQDCRDKALPWSSTQLLGLRRDLLDRDSPAFLGAFAEAVLPVVELDDDLARLWHGLTRLLAVVLSWISLTLTVLVLATEPHGWGSWVMVATTGVVLVLTALIVWRR